MTGILSDPDILIIGAGAAGLSAGRELARAKARFTILEARDRLGGRGWTLDATQYKPIDLGCGWLHSADTNPFVQVAEELGEPLDRSPAPWAKQADTRHFSLADQRDYRAAWKRFYDRLEAAEECVPDRRASEFLEPGNPWNGMLDAGSTFINGVELDGLSVVDYGRYHDSGVNYRAGIGFGALIARLGEGLPIASDCAAQVIDHSGQRIRVETSRGGFTARCVIVTVPTNIIADGALRFDPPLPDKVAAAQALPLGVADKLFLALDHADDLPIDARLYGRKDRTEMASYHLRPYGLPLIECYFGGAFARGLEAGGMPAFADYAIADIAGVLGADMTRRLTPLACSAWAQDPFARGSYSFARPGYSDQRAVLASPVDGRLFFAGEATSKHDFSTAHGAYRTGLASAHEALAIICQG
jgi:monoamine oxidase